MWSWFRRRNNSSKKSDSNGVAVNGSSRSPRNESSLRNGKTPSGYRASATSVSSENNILSHQESKSNFKKKKKKSRKDKRRSRGSVTDNGGLATANDIASVEPPPEDFIPELEDEAPPNGRDGRLTASSPSVVSLEEEK